MTVFARADRGFVLVLVLILAALLAALATAALTVSRSSATLARLGDELVQAETLLSAGTEGAAYLLFAQGRAPAIVDGMVLRLLAGSVEIRLRDEGGLVDLNHSDGRLLAGLYRALGLSRLKPEDFAALVTAWRGDPPEGDERASATENAGSEAGNETGNEAGEGRRHRLFRSVDELAAVPGIGASDVAALAPYLTVYNFDGRISLGGAPEMVLAAFPGLGSQEVRQILAQRRAARGRDDAAAELERLRGRYGGKLALARGAAGPAFRLSLTARLTQGLTSTAENVIVAGNRDDDPFRILLWTRP